MHEKVLPKGSRELLEALSRSKSAALEGWTLAGGTGLALHLGHRVSEDFDFFRATRIDWNELRNSMGAIGAYETLQEDDRTWTVLLAGVKLSFFHIDEKFLFELHSYRFFTVADPRDIALMKLIAISSRGSRRDFVDLYVMLRTGLDLRDCFEQLDARYGEQRVNAYHILKSLCYFEDAEAEPMPVMLEPFDWKECRAFFVREAAAIVLPPR
jgi:hypothetical protein